MTRIYCDGSTTEACYVIEGQDPEIRVHADVVTNNQGEYLAVIYALWQALRQGIKDIEILTDSELVVYQTLGRYKVKSPNLQHLWGILNWSAQKFDSFSIQHVDRENNPAGRVLDGK